MIATIDSSTGIVMVRMLDAPSLKNSKLGLETLELMGVPRERVRVVLNRADTSVGISHADVLGIFGRAPDVLVPSQREVVRSVNRGRTDRALGQALGAGQGVPSARGGLPRPSGRARPRPRKNGRRRLLART